MNAAACNEEGQDFVISDLREQRARLYAEVERLKQERNKAIEAQAIAEQETELLRARIRELEGK